MMELSPAWREGLRPDPFIVVSEWSDKYRILPRRGSAEHGNYRTSRVPYLREIMNKLSPHDPCRKVLLFKPRQIGGTEMAINFLFCMVHLYPGPGALIEPTLDLVKKVRRQKITPGITEMPVLRELIKPARERDSGNTTFSIEALNDALLIMGGANSSAGLRAVPLRYLVADEVDIWPQDVASAEGEGGEGDPLSILEKAMTTFANRKEFILSTPTIKGQSVIENEYEQSSRGRYYVPCPFCKKKQTLTFGNLIFDSKKPVSAEYQCEHCKKMIQEKYKTQMLSEGEWIHENPEAEAYGYHLNSLYSPWATWVEIAKEWARANYWMKVKKSNAKLKTFINTILAETWNEDASLSIDREALMGQLLDRREKYAPDVVPMDAAILVASADVQDDRIEILLKGYGAHMQSWALDHLIVYGNPAVQPPWDGLDQLLMRTWRHESGAVLPLAICFIDSGGHATRKSYEFTKPRFDRRIFSTKGSSEPKAELISQISIKNAERCPLFFIGTNEAKNLLFSRLIVSEPGAAYCHYNGQFDEEYFRQLCMSEKPEWKKGVKVWVEGKPRIHNEALDLEALNLAAAEAYIRHYPGFDLAAEVERLKAEAPKYEASKQVEEVPDEQAQENQVQHTGWITSITGKGW